MTISSSPTRTTPRLTDPRLTAPRRDHLELIELWRTVELFAADPHLAGRLDLTAPERRWEELAATTRFSVWLISWPPGTGTGWHDHGTAHGAFAVVRGQLTEHTWSPRGGERRRRLGTGEGRVFGPEHRHDVRSSGAETAVSVHAYSPELTAMGRYDLTTRGLVPTQETGARTW